MSKIIGLNVSCHDTCVAYIKDGEIKYVLEEEKLTGIKSCYNGNALPIKCLEILKNKEGVTLSNCDYIAYSNSIIRKYVKDNIDSFNGKTFCYSHHKCHALGSYFTSGFTGKVISLSIDGKGNQSRGKIYLCEDGDYEQVHSLNISSTSTLAGLWGCSTRYLGWTQLKDEGKVVGLAGHGKFSKEVYDTLNRVFYYKNFDFGPPEWENLLDYSFNTNNSEKFKDNTYRADFAFTLEYFTEECIKKYLIDISNKYPEYKKICFSGGLFANVKMNQFINNLNLFEEIYIHPAMSDAGLALGAAVCLANELGEYKYPKKLLNSFFGESHSKSDWDQELKKHSNNLCISRYDIKKIAKLIHDGFIIGLFIGRTEYGPRSLGNRSIIVRPTDKETHKKLNERLKRTEIMPFAPAILSEYVDKVYMNCKSKYTAEFMTLCYDTNPEWLPKIPAVVHEVDGTSRPQIVKKDSNLHFHNLISEYMKLSNIPIVLNTSFNAHGEPINNYPYQVIKHLLDNSVDFIVTEDYIINKK